jgi:CBS domain-containing protein
MTRDVPARDVMTTDVVAFSPEEPITEAMQRLVDRGIDAGPVLDQDRRVVGMLSTGDLMMQESQLHYPTVINLLGGLIEFPSTRRKFEHELSQAVAATVADAMTDKPFTVGPEDTLETVATVMHEHDVSRVPVVDANGALLGLVARGDILRAMIAPSAED